jgi:hypothetical protein
MESDDASPLSDQYTEKVLSPMRSFLIVFDSQIRSDSLKVLQLIEAPIVSTLSAS